MNKLLYLLILIFFVSYPATVMAQANAYSTIRPNLGKSLDKMASNAAENKVDSLQARAAKEIERRIAILQEILTKLANLNKVSSTTKSTLSTQIQTEINNLTALQTKIEQDTDPATTKTDVQSIVTQYRVFVVFLPQVRLLAAADGLTTAISQFSKFSEKLNSRISQAKADGNSTTALETLLADFNSKIQDAQKQADAIITSVSPLTPAGYPGNKSTLLTAQSNLKTGIQDLKSARQIALQIVQGLAAMKPSSNTGTTSATPQP